MAKMGRPKLEEPLVKDTKVRFTEKQYERLLAYAKLHDSTVAEVLRESVLKIIEEQEKK